MTPGSPPTYRARLRREGLTLAACGVLAALAVAAIFRPGGNELVGAGAQLLVVAGLLVVFGPRSAFKAMDRAEPLGGAHPGSGEPTPLWHVMAIVAVLTPLLSAPSAGVGGITFAGGAALVGLAQALLLARNVAREERETGREFFRRPGSRILRGTKLGWNAATPENRSREAQAATR